MIPYLRTSCLNSLVARASVESSSTIILTTISSNAGIRGMRVYISRRLRKCSIDSDNSTSASQLDLTPLPALVTWMSQGYLHMNWRAVHTSRRIARATSNAFAGGIFYKNRLRCGRSISAFRRPRPKASSLREAVAECVINFDTVVSTDFTILSLPRKLMNACVFWCKRVSTERQQRSCTAVGCSANAMLVLFS